MLLDLYAPFTSSTRVKKLDTRANHFNIDVDNDIKDDIFVIDNGDDDDSDDVSCSLTLTLIFSSFPLQRNIINLPLS